MKVALVGTRGVPARYGGFETAVEEIGSRLALAGHEVHVYCRNPGQRDTMHKGMHLHNLPALRRASLETLSHASLSVGHCVLRSRPDVAFLFNVANAPLLPLLHWGRIPTAIHIDGLEWRRAKWEGFGARYFEWAERFASRQPATIIADANAIGDHVQARYGKSSVMIPYGAPRIEMDDEILADQGLHSGNYHLVVARFEPENHVREIVMGYHNATTLQKPLIVVGDSPYSREYRAQIQAIASKDARIQLRGSIWDQAILDALYAGAASYIHGHSVGGTNPSLLRALGGGSPIVAHRNPFNTEVAGDLSDYFTTPEELALILQDLEANPDSFRNKAAMNQDRVITKYQWDHVAQQYEQLAKTLSSST